MKATMNPEDTLIAGAKNHFEQAQAALRTGCGHALMCGLHLIPLHERTVECRGGDRRSINVSRDTLKKGFAGAIAEVGIAKRTAYRWMDAAYKSCVRLGYITEGEDLAGVLPEVGSDGWGLWVKGLEELAQGMSINRLMLGNSRPSTEEHRYNELITATEEGRKQAEELLEGVALGKYSLVQAVRALGSREAIATLRAEGAEKLRRDPVYLTMDGETGQIGGLFVSSLSTLHNTFDPERWASVPEPAKRKARELWLAIIASLPADLKHG